MLPAIAQDCAEATGALWSSRTMMTRPLSSVVTVTPFGSEEKSPLEIGLLIKLLSRQRYSEMAWEQMDSCRRHRTRRDTNSGKVHGPQSTVHGRGWPSGVSPPRIGWNGLEQGERSARWGDWRRSQTAATSAPQSAMGLFHRGHSIRKQLRRKTYGNVFGGS